ncbi:MAG: YhcH/YjgK/YiaL family protein [Phascolarctobacterium sp.]|nr:YhcH/YjgK/YiaL family protein [Phascolarctobacterium sp.]
MICGNEKNLKKILPYLTENIKKALLYIATADFSGMENGEYTIDGRDIFYRVNTYTTEKKELRRPESHNNYIDVQYLNRGSETIWYCPKRGDEIVIEDKSEENDVLFYAPIDEKDCVNLKSGDFAIFFPWELHRPNCSFGDVPSDVQKIVVKVKAF